MTVLHGTHVHNFFNLFGEDSRSSQITSSSFSSPESWEWWFTHHSHSHIQYNTSVFRDAIEASVLFSGYADSGAFYQYLPTAASWAELTHWWLLSMCGGQLDRNRDEVTLTKKEERKCYTKFIILFTIFINCWQLLPYLL